VNFLFLALLVRSGLQILMDHPRLYWNVHCTPGTEWLRLTPIKVPKDRVWTAKDDSRYLSPWIGLPGYRHTIGMARHWHFLSVLFWVGNGLVFVTLLFATGQWGRLVPNSWQIVPDAWAVFVHYVTLHLPPEPNSLYHYNTLQQLAYFGVVFVLAPLAILTGPSMSPALTNRFKWYPQLPGNRQIGRSLHFLVMCAFVIFLIGHVTLVARTGLVRNMNHIVVGTDNTSLTGVYVGLLGLGVIAVLNALAKKTQITLHHCIQGWSGVAAWDGLPLAELIKRVRPKLDVRAVVFYSFGEGGEGGEFYDTLSMENAQHPQTATMRITSTPVSWPTSDVP
jgi:thiosulfate reductase cytochrome b subunit